MGVVKLSTAGILDYSKTPNFLSGNAPVSFGAFDLLETTTLTSSASSVTFSGLDSFSDYKHLQIRYVIRSDWGTTSSQNNITFNSDTGSNYAYHLLIGSGSSVSSLGYTSRSFIYGGIGTGANSATGAFGTGVIDILDFSATKNTTVRTLNGANDINRIGLDSGLWINTSAVTSATVTSNQGSYITGSRFSLYGVK